MFSCQSNCSIGYVNQDQKTVAPNSKQGLLKMFGGGRGLAAVKRFERSDASNVSSVNCRHGSVMPSNSSAALRGTGRRISRAGKMNIYDWSTQN